MIMLDCNWVLFACLLQTTFAQLRPDVKVGPTTPLSEKSKVCNVLDYASSSSQDDIGPPIMKAFAECILKGKGNRLVLPEGDYVLKTAVVLSGGSGWAFQMDGIITRDRSLLAYALIFIEHTFDIEFFSATTRGAIQGQGFLIRQGGVAHESTVLVRLQDVHNFAIHGLYLIDSPSFHMVLNGVQNGEVYFITVRGPIQGFSDGIDISGDNIHVHDIEVTNKDDCVVPKNPASHMLIEDIVCNTSGGMSIGSLKENAAVEYIHMRRIQTINTEQMIMIKIFPNGNGFVRHCLFEDFTAVNTMYAIDIDSSWQSSARGEHSAVAISDLTFRNFKGTLQDGVHRGPISGKGSAVVPAVDIVFENIEMTNLKSGKPKLQCDNIYGTGYCAKQKGGQGQQPQDPSQSHHKRSLERRHRHHRSHSRSHSHSSSHSHTQGDAHKLVTPIDIYTPEPVWAQKARKLQNEA